MVLKKELVMSYIEEIGKKSKAASYIAAKLTMEQKVNALNTVAKCLVDNTQRILDANAIDIENAKNKNISEGLLDRLSLNPKRIEQMAEGIIQVAGLKDPIGEVLSMENRPNGLTIGKKRVPLGVVGIIFESRPNVTADAFALTFKTGNAVILRGGSDAINSNKAIVEAIHEGLDKEGICQDIILLVEDTSRETATAMMKLNGYIDVLIPRGGAGLIASVVQNATIPVIETGTGNCHIYVNEFADFDVALDIIENAKLQRLGVCNACESLVVDKKIANDFIPKLVDRIGSRVEIRGDKIALEISNVIKPATQEDFSTEYLDKIISLKVVEGIDEAIAHINTHNTKHSEAIITANYDAAMKFLNEIDAAAVYVNASTRFTDGFEFGFGAEIGISTQKLHARGPMGLNELTTTKYIIFGQGQIRK